MSEENERVIDVRIGEKNEEEIKKTVGLEEFLESNKLTLGLLVLGIILLGAGLLGFKIFDFTSNQPKVEILGSEDEKWEVGRPARFALRSKAGGEVGVRSEEKITVEAAGEMIKPGIYEMAVDSRVNDLLIVAGGLSAEADREWVAKNINLAQKMTDGVKVFIPKKGGDVGEIREIGSIGEKININIASEKELDTLWGVGPATVKKIIEGRPYQKPEELLQKKIVKSNVWEKIKDKISVY